MMKNVMRLVNSALSATQEKPVSIFFIRLTVFCATQRNRIFRGRLKNPRISYSNNTS